MKPPGIMKEYCPESSNAYRVLVTHSHSMADKTLTLTRLHPEVNLDLTFIEEATMLHDMGIFLCNASDINRHGEVDYIYHGYPGANLMWKERYPRRALICERHTGTGLSLAMTEERNLPVPHRDVRPVSLEE